MLLLYVAGYTTHCLCPARSRRRPRVRFYLYPTHDIEPTMFIRTVTLPVSRARFSPCATSGGRRRVSTLQQAVELAVVVLLAVVVVVEVGGPMELQPSWYRRVPRPVAAVSSNINTGRSAGGRFARPEPRFRAGASMPSLCLAEDDP